MNPAFIEYLEGLAAGIAFNAVLWSAINLWKELRALRRQLKEIQQRLDRGVAPSTDYSDAWRRAYVDLLSRLQALERKNPAAPSLTLSETRKFNLD